MSDAVDQSRKYPTNAGQCDKCGYFKTWGFKVPNPKTGKQMPGHVTEAGFKIGDGNCPFYSKPATAGTIFEQKPLAAAAPPARDNNSSSSSDAILERIASLLRDIASDTQRIARKLDEAFSRLDERVQEARST